ncbi:hypothetical protein F4813DRAFT_243105 [Daldinia decipiens]|uniref:uncharacterized protein n=1 Tax=Daldinia decipiens TaxID=326647 RepID=UPI0020C3AEC9|nr:uncharacterized protein F4813DRAFT_243105 [Daldinia decipiens]KAI1653726.1 hypothetical protein F4813DRAFT_243105 [Daldinia decipiens]
MAPSDQLATAVPGRPKPPLAALGKHKVTAEAEKAPRAAVTTNITTGAGKWEADKSSPLEFRGFDFFANRDFNELKNASRAYFAPSSNPERRQRLPSTWLGDATPPSSPRPSDEGSSAGGDRPPAALRGQTPPGEKGIIGLKRTQFWWLLALISLLLVVAIGVGVGVGVGRGVSQSSNEAAAAVAGAGAGAGAGATSSTSLSSSSTTPANTGISTTSTSSPSKTSTSSSSTPTGNFEGKIDCPAANGTTYQVPGSDKRFLRICGIDYSDNESTNLRQVPTESILDCMKNCAGTAGCTGCGWGYIEGDTGTQHTCWLKGGLKKSHDVDINWAFAKLL